MMDVLTDNRRIEKLARLAFDSAASDGGESTGGRAA